MSHDVSAAANHKPVLRQASQRLVDELRAFNQRQEPNMILSSAFIGARAAQLAYLLSARCSPEADQHRHVSFFANSADEALSGSFKLARHIHLKRRGGPTSGRILVVDQSGELRRVFDPTAAGPARALAPGVELVPTVEAARARLLSEPWVGLAAPFSGRDCEDDQARSILAQAAEHGLTRIAMRFEAAVATPGFWAGAGEADVNVLGENLVDRQVPFGCFVMSPEAHQTWNNARDSTAHTSTFGANGFCVSFAIATLRAAGWVTDQDEEVLHFIARSDRARIDAYKRHVNAVVGQGMEMSGFAFGVARAQGSTLVLNDGSEVFDCAGGGGSVLRGHNPDDLSDLLDAHDAERDYFDELQAALAEVTGMAHALPAVSGASAVDTAIAAAMLARPGRTRIVTFRGNFSGKTLLSMSTSKSSDHFVDSDREAFRPYYFDLVEIEPESDDAARLLRQELLSGRVALVWFEVAQGMRCAALPPSLLAVVSECRASGGYLVGVDEVLTGFWRRGDDFLAHRALDWSADVVALAKPLSDATLPMGAALVQSWVWDAAVAQDPVQVRFLAQRYRCGINAHIALRALEHALQPTSQSARRETQRVLEEALRELARRASAFERCDGEAGHVRLVLTRRWFPMSQRSLAGQLVEAGTSDLIRRRCAVLVMQLRFFPAIYVGDANAVHDACARLLDGVGGLRPRDVYRHIARQIISFAIAQSRRDMAERKVARAHERSRRLQPS